MKPFLSLLFSIFLIGTSFAKDTRSDAMDLWSRPTPINPKIGNSKGRLLDMAPGSSGEVYLLWAAQGKLALSRVTPAQEPSAKARVFHRADGRVVQGEIAVGAKGLVAAWEEQDLKGLKKYRVWLSALKPSGRRRGKPYCLHKKGTWGSTRFQVGCDAKGNGFAVWQEPEGILTSRLLSKKGEWDNPKCIKGVFAKHVLAVGPNGEAVVVMIGRQKEMLMDVVRAMRFDPKRKQWGPAVTVHKGVEFSPKLQAIVAPNGDCLALWQQGSGEFSHMASRYIAEKREWTRAVTIPMGEMPRLAVLGEDEFMGLSVVTEEIKDVRRTKLVLSRFSNTAMRKADNTLFLYEILPNIYSEPACLVPGPERLCIAAWISDRAVYAAHYSPAAQTWTGAQPVASVRGGADRLRAGIDKNGKCMVLWTRPGKDQTAQVFSVVSE